MERVETKRFVNKKRVAGALSAVALFASGCSTPNFEIDDTSDQPIVTATELCPDVGVTETEEPKTPSDDSTEESAKELRPDPPRPHAEDFEGLLSGIIKDNIESEVSPFNFEKRYEFILHDSGMEMDIYSDGELDVDEGLLNELFHKPLYIAETIRDPDIRELYECYKENVIDKRLFEGEKIMLFVPSDSAVCIKNYGLDFIKDGSPCERRGFALPKVGIDSEETRWNPITLKFGSYITFVSAGRSDNETAQNELASVFAHEAAHIYDWLHEMPIQLTAIEQRAYYIQEKVEQHYESSGMITPILYQ